MISLIENEIQKSAAKLRKDYDMERIVTKPVKLDLHIHSCYSKHKDGDKVIHNTIENLHILYKKLAEESINMISITDHNVFNFELYSQINSDINNEKIDTGELIKCLPGVEFDVELRGEKVHVISIFNDENQKKLEAIPNVLKNTSFDNESKNAYTDFKLKEILTKIDINVVLIAHQKSDVRAKMHNDNLSKVGEKEFDNLISVDYFDAVEFRSGKVEGMLVNYKFENDLVNLRYITGTDCHDWSVYPKQEKTCKQDVTFSYIRSLCTFKGLVMALTEPSRIQIGTYGIRQPYIASLPITINDKKNYITLSSGINVIIGDNSIGKSLILEKFFNSKYLSQPNEIIEGHSKYLTSKNIRLDKIEDLEDVSVLYRGQGGIRDDFQNRNVNLKDIDFFKNKFLEVDNSDVKRIINTYVSNVWSLISQNQERSNKKKDLNYKLNIPAESEDRHYYLKIISQLNLDNSDYQSIVKSFALIQQEISKISEDVLFTHEEELESINSQIMSLSKLYESLKNRVETNNKIINLINSYSKSFNILYKKKQVEQEKLLQTFRESTITSHNRILGAIRVLTRPEIKPLENFKNIKLNECINAFGEYKFISRNYLGFLDNNEIVKILLYPFRNTKSMKSLSAILEDNIEEKFKKREVDKFNQQELTNEKLYYAIIERYCEENVFKQIYLINKNDTDFISGNSPGKNALIFLDVLSHDQLHQLVIVDQPGDDVSQNRVASELIEILKRMSTNDKQIILVTHKAELVVNLDADNVIVLKEDDSGEVSIEYGALEYEGNGFKGNRVNILGDVANILDGGVETIRRRWKRYDKKNN